MPENKTTKPKRIVIVGAGPAGLLAAILLLRRNRQQQREDTAPRYHVTVVDPGVDHGKLDADGLKRVRSWMIGLSAHGLTAIQSVPGLSDYVESLGTKITSATVALGKRWQFTQEMTEEELKKNPLTGFTVDRNYICAALARYLNDHFATDDQQSLFTGRYLTRALLVDGATKAILARSTESEGAEMETIPYDVVLGCDGVRSVVRGAILQAVREFEMDLRGTFGDFKSMHLPRPKDVPKFRFYYFFNCPPEAAGVVLPEPGDQINLAIGYSDKTEKPPEVLSSDPKIVADYFRRNFNLFDGVDWEEMGREWVSHSWSSTGQVHCNSYHSSKLAAIIMGDAAHATTPNIGQGMNTALADAKALNELLDEYKDDWDAVLPAFSESRVKEGNALTDLSFHTFSLDPMVQAIIVIRQAVRRSLNKILPSSLYETDPMNQIAIKGMPLSEAYNKMTKLGYIKHVRRVNDDIMREHFERKVGMVRDEPGGWMGQSRCAIAVTVALLAAGVSLYGSRKS